MQSKVIHESFRLDGETDRLLAELAATFEGNRSMALRLAVKAEAQRRGLKADAPRPAELAEREVCHA